MHSIYKARNFFAILQLLRIIYNIKDIDRLQFIKDQQICSNLSNASSKSEQFYILTRSNKTSRDNCDLEMIDLVEMNVHYNYIYVTKQNNFIFVAKNVCQQCGMRMIQTDNNMYLLDNKIGQDQENKFAVAEVYHNEINKEHNLAKFSE